MGPRRAKRIGRLLRGRWLSVALALAAVGALAVPIAVASLTTRSAAKVTAVSVKARDNGFTLSAPVAKAGTVRFVVKNLGKRNHNFSIGGKKTPVLKPGKTAVLIVELKKPGKYGYASTLSGDARKGLRGTFASVAALTAVGVRIRDNGFTLSAKSAPLGAVRFVVKNLGARPHNFRIGGQKTPLVKPGKAELQYVVFGKAGKYAYVSTLPGDARIGLKGTFTLTAKPPAGGNATLGKTIFVAQCGSCHELKAAGTNGTVGPNLDQTKPSLAKTISQVTSGGRFMPPFGTEQGGSLSAAQVEAVAQFIYAATH